MKRKGKASSFFTILNIFLIIVVVLAGIACYALYMFGNSESGIISAFGYSFFVSDETDELNNIEENTLITSKIIEPSELVNGQLVTVVQNSGIRFTAYCDSMTDNKEYCSFSDRQSRTFTLNVSQIKSVHLHKYHSEFIGRVFKALSDSKNALLISEAALMAILLISLIVAVARREHFKTPKLEHRNLPEQLCVDKLITVEHDVEFEHGKNTNKDE